VDRGNEFVPGFLKVVLTKCLWEAVARYFNEDRPNYDGIFRQPDEPTKSYMILRPEFWRGQQHGGRHDAVHAKHMRPRCDIISTGELYISVFYWLGLT
jgi:hypothetical protein